MNLSKETEQLLIMKLLGLEAKTENTAPQSPMVGKVCMIRTYSAGVHFGEVVSKNGQNVVLKNARRVWYWASACSLSQLAMEGDKKPKDCKISMEVNEIELDQAIEVIPMTSEAIENFKGIAPWKK